MGTNYYLHSGICPHCRRERSKMHIGKSSGGWTFSFHGYRQAWEEPPIRSWKDWQAYLAAELAAGNAEIRDEYGDAIALEAFARLVEGKKGERNNHTIYCEIHHPEHAARDCWLDDEGNSFSAGDFS